jgi:hypothetical protein
MPAVHTDLGQFVGVWGELYVFALRYGIVEIE